MWITRDIVLLANDKRANKGELFFLDGLCISGGSYCGEISQHLYITSSEEIKEGDWFIVADTIRHADLKQQVGKYVMSIGNDTINSFYKEGCKKIIATTDTSLDLPKLPKEFIKYFICEYNKGNVITKIEVEYSPNYNNKGESIWELEVNIWDNTINIKPIKESWSKEEVIVIIHKLFKETSTAYHEWLHERWIEEHL